MSTPRVYKHRTGAESLNLCADQHPAFAILITANVADSTRSSRLYFGQPCLDFQQDNMHGLFVLKKMLCLNYASYLEKPSKKDFLKHLDQEGGPDVWDLITEDLPLTDHEGRPKRYSFLNGDGLETDHCHVRSQSGVDGSTHRLATPIQ